MMPGSVPEESTAGKSEALRALRESRLSRRRTRVVVEQVTRQLQESAALRKRNHFTDGVQEMLRGTT
jgi:hypothetical protein